MCKNFEIKKILIWNWPKSPWTAKPISLVTFLVDSMSLKSARVHYCRKSTLKSCTLASHCHCHLVKITFSFMSTWTQHRLLRELKTSWKTFSAFEEAGVSTWPCCAAMRCKTVDFWKIYCIKKLVLQLKETKVDNSNQDPTCMESWCAKRHKSSASTMGGTLYVSS